MLSGARLAPSKGMGKNSGKMYPPRVAPILSGNQS